jgi:transcriptional regulator with PAS, ATPase and Fis domain
LIVSDNNDIIDANGTDINDKMKEIQSKIEQYKSAAIVLNSDYTIISANKAFKHKYQSKLILGSSKCYEVSHQAQQPCHLNGESCPLKECINTNKKQSVLHIHQHNNDLEYCDIQMQPVVYEGEKYFIEVLEQVEFANVTGESGKLIGQSVCFKRLISTINKSAKTNINILLHGETGTGKELVASAIHQASKRKNKPFIIVECTGLNESLFESELFGHEKGAFTGAHHTKKGLVELADGGTLFLDEIGDIPFNIQVKLLRLLETGTYRRVGGTQQLMADFRLICASHKNLTELVEKQLFREDLYYRIASFPIELPNLANRVSDIHLLANYFLQQSEFHYKKFSEKCLLLLQKLPFKGNIRELKNIVERLAVISDDDIIGDDILLSIYPDISSVDNALPARLQTYDSLPVTTLKEAEYLYIQSVIARFPDKPLYEIAKLLNISVRTLYRKL